LRRIYICVPVYQTIPAESFQSILSACLKLQSKYKQIGTCFCSHTYLPEARNVIANNILQTSKGDDLVLWIDSDMVFNFNQVEQLIKNFDSNDYDLLSGLYFTRNDKEKRKAHLYFATEEKGRFNAGVPIDLPKTGIVKVDAVGFGFVVMKAKVLQRLKNKYGRVFDCELYKKELVGEDIIFCQRATEQGFKIGADVGITIGHFGAVIKDMN